MRAQAARGLAEAMESKGDGVFLDAYSIPNNPLAHMRGTGRSQTGPEAKLLPYQVAGCENIPCINQGRGLHRKSMTPNACGPVC
eukprot:scaffold47117_cov19-Tisochrysis_lutea.AAC.1